MRSRLLAALTGLCVLLALPAGLQAAEPTTLAVHGALRTAGGGPVADGTYVFIVGLYDAADAPAPVWDETLAKVEVAGGTFSTQLGANPAKPFGKDLLVSGKPLWLGVAVGSDPELPRKRLETAPAAWFAHNAAALSCSGCLTGAQVAPGSLGQDKVSFTFAGSDSKGGSALHALAADGAKEALHAKTADKATAADEAAGLQCTGCVSPGALSAATKAAFVSSQGGTITGDLAVSGGVAAEKASVGSELALGKAVVTGGRFEALDVAQAPCTADEAGRIALDTATKRLFFCDGGKYRRLTICSAECPPAETVACGKAVVDSCGENDTCQGSGTLCASGSTCVGGKCLGLGDDKSVPGSSCKHILTVRGKVPDGAYWLDPNGGQASDAFQAFCDMTNEGGGWTLVMRFKNDNGLGYGNALWSNDKLLNEDAGGALDPAVNANAKFAAYSQVPGGELRGCKGSKGDCVSQGTGGSKTVLQLMTEGYKQGNLSRSTFVSWFGNDPGQPNCNASGINGTFTYAGFRFGLVGNNENECNSADSAWGWGVFGSNNQAAGCGCGLAGWSVASACFQGTLWIR